MLPSDSPITIVGAGALGQALGRAVHEAGRPVQAVVSRSRTRGEALARELQAAYRPSPEELSGPVTILCLPDDHIRSVAGTLTLASDAMVIHCAGSRGLDILESVTAAGGHPGSLHPVMVLARSGRGPEAFRGATAAIDGDDWSRPWLRQLAADLGMRAVDIPEDRRALYHLSAALVGGLMTGLLAAASDLWRTLGLDREAGAAALAPMVREAGLNLEQLGVPAVVMGPAVRGDIGTLQRHLDELEIHAPDLLPLYRELVLLNLPFAVEDGRLEVEKADAVRTLMTSSREATRHLRG